MAIKSIETDLLLDLTGVMVIRSASNVIISKADIIISKANVRISKVNISH